MRIKLYSPAVKREAEVSALQDLTGVMAEHIWRGSDVLSFKPVSMAEKVNLFSWDSRPYVKHTGVDILGKRGDPIYAVFGGKVWIAPDNNGWVYVHITTVSGIVDRYYHLDEVWVKSGDVVSDGQQIGTMGDKGKATGVHLHFNSTTAEGYTLDAYPRLFGRVDVWNREKDPENSKRNPGGFLELEDTDPYETVVSAEPVAYRVDVKGSRLNVRKRPGANFELTGEKIPDGEVILIDKWANYDRRENGEFAQSWGRLAGRPWNWVALRYGIWNVKRV